MPCPRIHIGLQPVPRTGQPSARRPTLRSAAAPAPASQIGSGAPGAGDKVISSNAKCRPLWLTGLPDPQLSALIDELAGLIPDRPRDPGPNHLGFAVPLRLSTPDGELNLLTTLSHFGTAINVTVAELRLEAFLPADERTAAVLSARDVPAAG